MKKKKINCAGQMTLFLLAFFVLIFGDGINKPCFGSGADYTRMINRKISQNEGLWVSGKKHDYYLGASNILEDILLNSKNGSLNESAAALFGNLLSKEVDVDKVGLDDLLIMQKLASYLISSNGNVDERHINAKLLCGYLGKMRKEIVPNFKPKLVFENVEPPLGVAGAAGMDPKAIKDPVARIKYEASIRENSMNNIVNSRQTTLLNTEKQTVKSIVSYIIEAFNAGDAPSSDFIECIRLGNFSEGEKVEILRRLEGKTSPQK